MKTSLFVIVTSLAVFVSIAHADIPTTKKVVIRNEDAQQEYVRMTTAYTDSKGESVSPPVEEKDCNGVKISVIKSTGKYGMTCADRVNLLTAENADDVVTSRYKCMGSVGAENWRDVSFMKTVGRGFKDLFLSRSMCSN